MLHAIATLPITPTDTSASLYDKLADIGPKALLEALADLPALQQKAVVQDDAVANYAEKLSKEEALLDFNKTAAALEREIRAFNPWPVSYLQLGNQQLKIWQARVEPLTETVTSGTVLKVDKKGIVIATGEGALVLEQLQHRQAKKPWLLLILLTAAPGLVSAWASIGCISMSANLRAVAATCCYQVVDQGKSLSDVLPKAQLQFDNPADKALLQEICFGVLRHLPLLDFVCQQLMAKPLIKTIKTIAVFNLCRYLSAEIFAHYQDHAAVGETVEAARYLKGQSMTKLINGVLRSVQRKPELFDVSQAPMPVQTNQPILVSDFSTKRLSRAVATNSGGQSAKKPRSGSGSINNAAASMRFVRP